MARKPKRIICFELSLSAPTGSEEESSFLKANHWYEYAEAERSAKKDATKYSMRALRAYKKAWQLRQIRLN